MGSFDDVPGEVKGVFFKGAINSLLGGDMLFPEIAATVAEFDDEGWYPWSMYLNNLETIAGTLNEMVLKVAGSNLVYAAKQVFLDQGFTTLESVLSAYPAMFDMNVRGVLPSHGVELISYTDGRAEFIYGAQPAAVIEGYFSGFFKIYDQAIDEITLVPEGDGQRVTITWTPD